MDEFQRHGGRLEAAMRRWPDAPRPWIDLSTGVNPHPYPAPRATRAQRAALPDPEELQRLEALAARRFGVSADGIAATAGAEAALRLLPHLLGARRVAIPGPTYGGHAEAWTAAGAQVVDEVTGAPVAVVVNPNNPDGREQAPERLLTLADDLARRDGWLVVDESFGEVRPELSVAGAAHPRTIVLRSFGKMFGLPGLRLGFVLATPPLLARLRALMGDWPVGADALAAGLAAYADDGWLDRARRRVASDAARLDGLLRRAGWEVVGGVDLFRLARAPDAWARFEGLARAGVLTRPFAADPAWLRFGLPPRWGWSRLAAALESAA